MFTVQSSEKHLKYVKRKKDKEMNIGDNLSFYTF